MKKYFAIIALLAIVTACGAVSTSSSGTKPGEASSGFMGLSKTDDVTVDTAAAFKGKNQVIIGSFKIGFVEDKKASNKAGGGLTGNGFGGRATANTTLKNVTVEDEQKITDAAYADFKTRLEAAGYTIADRNLLLQHEDFKDVSKDKSPYKEESSWFGSDTQMTYLTPSALGSDLYWSGESGHTGGFAFGNSMMGAALAAQKLNIPVLFVNYTVDFANAGGHGGSWTMSASVEVGQGISVPAGNGRIMLFGGEGGTFSTNNGTIGLGQAVYSEETYGEIVNTNTDAGVAAQYAINVVSLLGGVGSNQSRSYDFNADPAKYSAISKKVLGQANGKLVDKMKELR